MLWKREQFDYRNPYAPREPRTVTGHTSGPFGLHKMGGRWRLVHIPSGFEIDGQFHTNLLKHAKATAEKLAPLADWTRSQDEICETVGLLAATRRVLHPARYA